MTLDQLLSRLTVLPSEKPSTKMGQVRWAWPEIRAALASGHSLRTIHSRLNEVGIEIGYRTLSLYIGRLERQRLPTRNEQITAAAGTGKRMADKLAGEAVESRLSRTAASDPFSNVRLDRERKKSGTFEYDAFSTNKDLLA
jgi:hypothetical protein